MELILIVGALAIGLIILLGKYHEAKIKAATADDYKKALRAQEESVANDIEEIINNGDIDTTISFLNGLRKDEDRPS